MSSINCDTSTQGLLPTRPPQLWGLMDCNNFYASCERIFRPDLARRPIVVLSNNDGCIVARSAEAKALGIPMGAPEFQQRTLLKKHNVAVFSSNYALYGDISNRVMQIAETLLPSTKQKSPVEQYSIDEAFLSLTGAALVNAESLAWDMRRCILQWTGITVGIGIAPTKTLAKLANNIAKKNSGVFFFPTNASEQDTALAAIPVEDVWGIGRRHATKLRAHGVYTAKDLRDADTVWIKKHLTVTGLYTALELRGIPCITGTIGSTRRTLVSSRSFGVKIYAKADLAEALCSFTSNAAVRLRQEKLYAKGIAVHVRASKHGCTHGDNGANLDKMYNETIHMTLPEATSDTKTLLAAAMRGLDAAFKEGVAYAKAGVMFYDLCPAHALQGNLLHLLDPQKKRDSERADTLMKTLDAINNRYGRHTVKHAGEGVCKDALWRMRQQFLSPKYTSAWDALPVAFCK